MARKSYSYGSRYGTPIQLPEFKPYVPQYRDDNDEDLELEAARIALRNNAALQQTQGQIQLQQQAQQQQVQQGRDEDAQLTAELRELNDPGINFILDGNMSGRVAAITNAASNPHQHAEALEMYNEIRAARDASKIDETDVTNLLARGTAASKYLAEQFRSFLNRDYDKTEVVLPNGQRETFGKLFSRNDLSKSRAYLDVLNVPTQVQDVLGLGKDATEYTDSRGVTHPLSAMHREAFGRVADMLPGVNSLGTGGLMEPPDSKALPASMARFAPGILSSMLDDWEDVREQFLKTPKKKRGDDFISSTEYADAEKATTELYLNLTRHAPYSGCVPFLTTAAPLIKSRVANGENPVSIVTGLFSDVDDWTMTAANPYSPKDANGQPFISDRTRNETMFTIRALLDDGTAAHRYTRAPEQRQRVQHLFNEQLRFEHERGINPLAMCIQSYGREQGTKLYGEYVRSYVYGDVRTTPNPFTELETFNRRLDKVFTSTRRSPEAKGDPTKSDAVNPLMHEASVGIKKTLNEHVGPMLMQYKTMSKAAKHLDEKIDDPLTPGKQTTRRVRLVEDLKKTCQRVFCDDDSIWDADADALYEWMARESVDRTFAEASSLNETFGPETALQRVFSMSTDEMIEQGLVFTLTPERLEELPPATRVSERKRANADADAIRSIVASTLATMAPDDPEALVPSLIDDIVVTRSSSFRDPQSKASPDDERAAAISVTKSMYRSAMKEKDPVVRSAKLKQLESLRRQGYAWTHTGKYHVLFDPAHDDPNVHLQRGPASLEALAKHFGTTVDKLKASRQLIPDMTLKQYTNLNEWELDLNALGGQSAYKIEKGDFSKKFQDADQANMDAIEFANQCQLWLQRDREAAREATRVTGSQTPEVSEPKSK